MAGGHLKIGVMLDSLVVPAWVDKVFSDIKTADFLELSLIILNGEKRDPSYAKQLPGLLFLLYEKVDQRLFSWRYQRLDSANVEMIKGQGLDVMLKLGFNELAGEILSSTRYGIWSLHHGDDREYRGGPPHFWEIYEENPVSGSSLQILAEEPAHGRVIYRSLSSTHPYSLFRNRNQIYWKSADFMKRCLKIMHRNGWDCITSLETYTQDATYGTQLYKTPTWPELARGLPGRGIVYSATMTSGI